VFAGVADTHAALWCLFADLRLSSVARSFIDTAAQSSRKIALSAISVAEIVYLMEKKRISATVFDDIKRALDNPNHVFEEAPFTVKIAEAMRQIPRDAVPDMPDRIVAATAVFLGVPLISRDGHIRSSGVQTVW
jgi:PIN domain nuclease of toxin-antitoxin system